MKIGDGLTLVTGATGSGKTAFVVSWLRSVEGRPVYVQGIPGLRLPHSPAPPVADWVVERQSPEDPTLSLPYFDFPAQSWLIVDEAQRIYSPRPVSSRVPAIVGALSTRRHTGMDCVLLTQHPALLDAAVRRLVTTHFHVHTTPYGRFLLRWDGAVGDPSSSADRKLAERVRYSPDPAVFPLYQSAEAHTPRLRRIPRSAIVGSVLVLAVVGLSAFIYQRFAARLEPSKPATVASSGVASSPAGSARQSTAPASSDYLAERIPAVPGLLHTAPVYEGLVRVKSFPYPVGCIASRDDCRCYDQRGGVYPATADICRQWIRQPPFLDFLADSGRADRETISGESPAAEAPAVGRIPHDAGKGVSEVGPGGRPAAGGPGGGAAAGAAAAPGGVGRPASAPVSGKLSG